MCLPLRDKNLWCCGPRSIEMWLANCAPVQPKLARFSPGQSTTAGDLTAVHEIFRAETHRMFSPRQKSSPKNKAWKLASLCLAGVRVSLSRPNPRMETPWIFFFFFSWIKGQEKKVSVAVTLRLERTRVCSTGSVLIHPLLSGAIPNSNTKA